MRLKEKLMAIIECTANSYADDASQEVDDVIERHTDDAYSDIEAIIEEAFDEIDGMYDVDDILDMDVREYIQDVIEGTIY